MKTRSFLTVLALFFILLIFYSIARFRVDSYRTDFVYRLHVAAAPLPAELLNALAGEFKGMVANYLLLEAASFIGSQQTASPDDWNAVARLLDQSSRLDPYFRQTYRLAQSTLPWQAKKIDQTITILERSRKHLAWDWMPGFYIGFDYYYFLNDNFTASQKLMEASRVPAAPLTLATLGSRLASKAGQTSAAIDFLNAIYEKTEDEETQKILRERIAALKGVEELQSAVDRFQAQFRRMPDTFDELVNTSIISAIPANPYGRPYTLKDGNVEF